MMEAHELLDVLHLLVQRHLESLEYSRNHLGTDYLVTVEGPAHRRVETLGDRLADVVQQGRPTKPHIRLGPHRLHKTVSALIGCGILQSTGRDALDLRGRHIVNDLESV